MTRTRLSPEASSYWRFCLLVGSLPRVYFHCWSPLNQILSAAVPLTGTHSVAMRLYDSALELCHSALELYRSALELYHSAAALDHGYILVLMFDENRPTYVQCKLVYTIYFPQKIPKLTKIRAVDVKGHSPRRISWWKESCYWFLILKCILHLDIDQRVF